jgi:uncharacterized protein with PIN domain
VRARLYLDEDLTPDLARLLRAAGHDVVSAHERGASGLSDEDQLELATAEDRALLSFNYRDFIALSQRWSKDNRQHAGIIVSYRQYSRRALGQLTRAVIALLDQVTGEDLASTLRSLDEFRRS